MSGETKYGEWQPIETAPKDGVKILVFVPRIRVVKSNGKSFKDYAERILMAWWSTDPESADHFKLKKHAVDLLEKHGGFWTTDKMGRNPIHGCPTHWMPLAEPPQ